MADYHFMGVGNVYMKEVGASAGLLPIGNVDALSFAVQEEIIKKKDRTTPGGGTANEVRRIESAEMSISMSELSPTNLGRALFGDVNAISSGSATDEAHTAYQGALVPTKYVNPTSVVVTGSGGTPTYTVTTDYVVTEHGILIVDGGGISNGTAIEIDYSYAAVDIVEAIRNSAKEFEMVFAGLNEANSDRAARVTAHRFKMGAASELALITDEHAVLAVSGELTKDTSKPAGESQYFNIQMEQ